MTGDRFTSWGRVFPGIDAENIFRPLSKRDIQNIVKNPTSTLLAIGQGKSYGDVGLNYDGRLIDMRAFDQFLGFDATSGLLEVAAGVTYEDILRTMVPRGWFLPVVPGTQLISSGGAVANDIHGKNHHVAGTVGAHIEALTLLRSTGESILAQRNQNNEIMQATIGGLGLTGLIRSVTLQLKAIRSAYFDVHYIPFQNLEEFINLETRNDANFDYTVAWVDCLSRGKGNQGPRGIFMRGRHREDGDLALRGRKYKPIIPFDLPNGTLNSRSVKIFNELYYLAHNQFKKGPQRVYYEDFLFPLDHVQHWNRIYGSSGFYQYQFVVPADQTEILQEIFKKIRESNLASFLAVLKKFGESPSPGMLTFPMSGFTLALDFPGRLKQEVFSLFARLDELVAKAGGRLYPAKDSCMSEEFFKTTYPRWREFSKYLDPSFSSAFAKRVGLCR